jgi:tetratricopeptide (TPR) repeat protein
MYKKAVAAYQNQELDVSIQLANEILTSRPDNFLTLNLLVSIYSLNGDFEKALFYVEKSIEIKPQNVNALQGKGYILFRLERYEESLIYYSKSISIEPNSRVLNNMGIIFSKLSRYKEALDCYEKGISVNLDNHTNVFGKSCLLLLMGELEKGFRFYESRWDIDFFKNKKKITQPLWLGNQDLSDKKILIYGEQGFGDTIQMCRYVNELGLLGVQIILEVSKYLKTLFSDNKIDAHIICEGDLLPDFDYYCPIMSLPLAFKTDLYSIISSPSYIKSSPDVVEEWREKLPKKTKLFIGVVWTGSVTYKDDKERSLLFSQLTPLFREDCQFVSLQKEISSSDLEELKKSNKVLHFGDQLRDFSDTAALIEHMDLVITVDTSVAHLSGAMGKPTWILTRKNPDWRWLLERDDSPWYPSVKLFRQSLRNNWDDVFLKIKGELDLFTSID